MPQLSPIFWSFFPLVMFLMVMISLSFLLCFSGDGYLLDSREEKILHQAWWW